MDVSNIFKRSGFWTLLLWIAASLTGCGGGGDGSVASPPPVEPPSIAAQPQDASVAVGTSAGFSVSATGTAPLQYQWQRGGADIAGATAATLTIAAAVTADNGAELRVVVRNAAGSVTSRTASLTVSATEAPAITTPPQPISVAAGQGASFSVAATGAAPLAFQWLRDGTAIGGATASTFQLTTVAAADNGASFSVRVSNATGAVTSSAAVLTVTTSAGPTGTGLAAGYDVSYAIRDDGSVLQLSSEPPWTRLPSSAVGGSSARALTGLSAAVIDIDRLHALAVGRDGLLYGWGLNQNGRLGGSEGNGNVNAPRVLGGVSAVRQALATSGYSLALRDDGSVWHWPGVIRFATGGPAVSEPGSVDGLTGVTALAALGANFDGDRLLPAAIKSDGTVWELRWDVQTVMGSGGPVQTYTGSARRIDNLSDVARISCNYSHCLAVTRAGTVLAWGSNGAGQLGNGSTSSSVNTPTLVPGLTGVRAVTVTGAASMALTADGRVWTWGDRDSNGHGGNDNLMAPTVLVLPAPVVQMAGGWQHTAVRLDDGSLWGWGANQGTQLGDGSTQTRRTPVQATGVALN